MPEDASDPGTTVLRIRGEGLVLPAEIEPYFVDVVGRLAEEIQLRKVGLVPRRRIRRSQT